MPLAKPNQTVIVKGRGVLSSISMNRIRETIPDVKLLLVVRNPIDRVVSDIVHEYTSGELKGKPMPNVDDIIMGRTGIIPRKTGM